MEPNNRIQQEYKYWSDVAKRQSIVEIYDNYPAAKSITTLIQAAMPSNIFNVVELGSATGRLTSLLAASNPEKLFIGIDIAPKMKPLFQDTCKGLENTKWRFCDGRTLDCVTDVQDIDFVYSVTVFQHIDDAGVQAYLDNIYKHLKTGGKLFFQYVQGKEKEALSWQRTKLEIEKMCTKSGFKIESHSENKLLLNWNFLLVIK